MKTDDLITLLATAAQPVDAGAPERRFVLAAGTGLALALLLMLGLLGLNPQLEADSRLPMFWVKLVFGGLVAAAASVALYRLARPGTRLAWLPLALISPFVAIWVLGLVGLLTTPPVARVDAWMGSSWSDCPVYIGILSIPAFVCGLLLMRSMAPTRSVLAGAVTGLWAGGIGAFAYALHCTEMAAPFLATWYVLGMLVPTAAGALLGPRLLRW
jgi:hypothetical protein